jgi:hypothetical protein
LTGAAVAEAVQLIDGHWVMVGDPCATFFRNLAQGGAMPRILANGNDREPLFVSIRDYASKFIPAKSNESAHTNANGFERAYSPAEHTMSQIAWRLNFLATPSFSSLQTGIHHIFLRS